jgi:hypothetical protein
LAAKASSALALSRMKVRSPSLTVVVADMVVRANGWGEERWLRDARSVGDTAETNGGRSTRFCSCSIHKLFTIQYIAVQRLHLQSKSSVVSRLSEGSGVNMGMAACGGKNPSRRSVSCERGGFLKNLSDFLTIHQWGRVRRRMRSNFGAILRLGGGNWRDRFPG